ncbi:MAG TPA: discoidin domain-containing protein [Kiritimatiellia bacterium]|nr:discoidin domain-containing protein [Kiritimatiellia bacterium]
MLLLCGIALRWLACGASALPSDAEYFHAIASGAWQSVPGDSRSDGDPGAMGWAVSDGRPHVVWPASSGPVERAVRVRLRDARAGSEREVELTPRVTQAGSRLRLDQRLDAWGVEVELVLAARGTHVEGAARLRGLTTNDAPLRVEVALDAPGKDWRWWDDGRRWRAVTGAGVYANLTRVLAGYDGHMSRYPYACLASDREALALAVPLLRPRVFQLVYDAASTEYRLAVDVTLSPATAKFPNEATFFFSLFASDPAEGFRGVIERYGRIHPEAFVKRVAWEGVWMPFTRINDVRDAEGFHFGFHEYGAVDLEYNRRHGIHSFLYVEPWTYWMAMPPEQPRETGEAMRLLDKNAAEGDAWNRPMAVATRISAMHDASGDPMHQFVDQPWCSGTLFFNNSDPDLAAPGGEGFSAGALNLDIARREVLERERVVLPGWDPYAEGYRVDNEQSHDSGTRSLLLERAPGQGDRGAVQFVTLDQRTATPIRISGWSRAENVSPGAAINYSLYADLTYQDGSNSWGHAVGFDDGTHAWQQRELLITPAAPVKTVSLHALFRGDRTGRAWFDQLALKEIPDARNGSGVAAEDLAALPNRLRDGTFGGAPVELRADGMYLDSLEGWANRLNFRADHFAAVDVPLAYETGSGRTAIFNLFSIFEFTRAMAESLHAHDRLLMGNWVLIDFPFLGALLDVPGKEVHWLDAQHAFAPDSDETMLYRRTLSGTKPYPLLLNVTFEHFTPAMMRKFFERSLFYAFYPGMFSHDAATNPYFEDPALYDRDRDLFLKYIPMVRALSAAGWEPVTRAASSHPEILVERYGRRPDDGLYFTFHHDGDGWAGADIRIEAGALEITNRVRLLDVTDGGVVALGNPGEPLDFSTRLGGYGTRVIRLIEDTPAALGAFAAEHVGALRAVVVRHEAQGKLAAAAAGELRGLLGRVAEESATGERDGLLRALRRVQRLRGLTAAYARNDFARAVAAAENALSDAAAMALGLSFSVTTPDALVSPSESSCVVELENRCSDAVEIRSIRLAFDLSDRARADAASAPGGVAAPGESMRRAISFSVPAGAAPDAECAMRISVEGVVAAQPFTLARTVRARVVSGFDLRLAPGRVLSVQPEAEWTVMLANHHAEARDVALHARVEGPGPVALSWTQSQVRVEAGRTLALPLRLSTPHPERRADYAVVVSSAWGAATGALVRFPASSNLLADANVEVRVDSTFAGYSIGALRDGIIEIEGLDWSESAWASADLHVPHWVEARWPSPRRIQGASVYWANDGGTYFRSARYRLQVRRDGRWMDLADTREDDAARGLTRHTFGPVTTDGVRMWQEAGGGHASRANLLWLREFAIHGE